MGVSRQAHRRLPARQRLTQNASSARPGRGGSPLRDQPGVSRKPVRLPVPEGPRLRAGASLRRWLGGLGKRGVSAGGRKRRVAEEGGFWEGSPDTTSIRGRASGELLTTPLLGRW